MKKVVLAAPPLRERYATIQRERAEAEGGEPMDMS